MEGHQTFSSSFVNKNTFISLSPDYFHKWKVKNSSSTINLPATPCYPPFTCLSWKLQSRKKLKEQNTGKQHKANFSKNLKIMQKYAIGTSKGEILLINATGKEILKFNGGHSDQVNCISWNSDDSFFSCSNDCHIVEWNINEVTHKWKWKADKAAITSLTMGPDSRTLISAGKCIKIWNLKSKKLLWKFNSLKSPVFTISPLSLSSFTSSKVKKSSRESLDGLYLLSASHNENAIKVWRVDTLKQERDVTYTFDLSSPPRSYDVITPRLPGKPVKLLVVTENDQVLLFSLVPNGGKRKPCSAIKTIKLLDKFDVALKILNARLKKSKKSNVVTVAYGSSSNVNFKAIDLNSYDEKDIVIRCNPPTQQKAKLNKRKSEVDSGEKSVAKKKRKKSDCPGLLPEEIKKSVDERTNYEEHSMTSGSNASFSQLCQKLSEDFKGNSSDWLNHVKWLKEAVEKHSSKLETVSLESPICGRLQQLVGLRLKLESVLPRLQGKLDLVIGQVAQRQLDEVGQDALQIYEEESSDEMDYSMPFEMSDAIEESDDIRLDSGSSGDSDSASESSFEQENNI